MEKPRIIMQMTSSPEAQDNLSMCSPYTKSPKGPDKELSNKDNQNTTQFVIEGGAEQMTISPKEQNYLSMNSPYTKSRMVLDEELNNKDNQYTTKFMIEGGAEPLFEDYQLIGDSQFLRFSEQLLSYWCKTDPFNGKRALGLCVSGQTVDDLWTRIVSKQYVVAEKVILLIGTNDMLMNTPLENMKVSLKAVLTELEKSAKEIIVLTLPPLPCQSHMYAHWYRLAVYNNYIKKQEKGRKIRVADVTGLFTNGYRQCYIDDFELFYSDKKRPDRLHLNRQGLQKIHCFLLQEMS